MWFNHIYSRHKFINRFSYDRLIWDISDRNTQVVIEIDLIIGFVKLRSYVSIEFTDSHSSVKMMQQA